MIRHFVLPFKTLFGVPYGGPLDKTTNLDDLRL